MTVDEVYKQWKCTYCGNITSLGNGEICSVCGCECCCNCTGTQQESPVPGDSGCPRCDAGPEKLKIPTESNNTLEKRVERLETAEAERQTAARQDPMRRIFMEAFHDCEAAKIGYGQSESMVLGFVDNGDGTGKVELVLQCNGGPTAVLYYATWGREDSFDQTCEEARTRVAEIGKKLDLHRLLYHGGQR